MKLIIINVLRGVKKRIVQYLSIMLLIIISFGTISGLYSNSGRIKAGFNEVISNSGLYDYRLKVDRLNYRNKENDKKQDKKPISDIIKAIIKEDIDSDLNKLPKSDKALVEQQIDIITMETLKDNLLPNNIHEVLQTYLLNWGVNYKVILINHVISELKKKYQVDFSFHRSFSKYDKNNHITYNFEDAFLSNDESDSRKNNFNYMPNRNGINEVYIKYGKRPETFAQVVINPEFAKYHAIALNQEFKPILNSEIEFKLQVSGFGYAYVGINARITPSNPNPSYRDTTQVFTTQKWFNEYLLKHKKENSVPHHNINIFLKTKKTKPIFLDKLKQALNEYFHFQNDNILVADLYDFESGALKNNFNTINTIYGIISGAVLLVITFVVLAYVHKEINLQKKQIGMLKALGCESFELSIGFATLICLVTLVAFIFGYALSIPMQLIFNALGFKKFFLPLSYIYIDPLLIVLVFAIPSSFFLISYALSVIKLKSNNLKLIYDTTVTKTNHIFVVLKGFFSTLPFKIKIKFAFALKSFSKLILLFFVFVFTSFLILFQSIATDIFYHKIDNSYAYLNPNITNMKLTAPMYQDNAPKTPVFDWVWQNDKDTKKLRELKASDFDLKSDYKNTESENFVKIQRKKANLRGTFITNAEIAKIYQEHKKRQKLQLSPLQRIIDEELEKFFAHYFKLLGIKKPSDHKRWKGISFGKYIINNGSYPNLRFNLSPIMQWFGYNNGKNNANNIYVNGLYNDWKSWFNFKVKSNNVNLDELFSKSHDLETTNVRYLDRFGRKEEHAATYIIPAAISKNLAILSDYKVNNKIMMLVNVDNSFVPVIFQINAIVENNLDDATFFVNIDDLRKSIKYVDENNKPLENSFNNIYSQTDDDIIPLFNRSGDYSNYENVNLPIINEITFFNLNKKAMSEIFKSTKSILEVTKWFAFIAVTFILIIIINMVLENNLAIINMMKCLGYRITEINRLIIGAYFFVIIIAFFVGCFLSFFVWRIAVNVIALNSGMVLYVPISLITIFIGFIFTLLILIIGYIVALQLIKSRRLTTLL